MKILFLSTCTLTEHAGTSPSTCVGADQMRDIYRLLKQHPMSCDEAVHTLLGRPRYRLPVQVQSRHYPSIQVQSRHYPSTATMTSTLPTLAKGLPCGSLGGHTVEEVEAAWDVVRKTGRLPREQVNKLSADGGVRVLGCHGRVGGCVQHIVYRQPEGGRPPLVDLEPCGQVERRARVSLCVLRHVGWAIRVEHLGAAR